MQSNGDTFRTFPADHENAAAFGPCEGPATDPTPDKDLSWACRGPATERLDPLSEEFKNAILCRSCNSIREGYVIDRAVSIMMESAA